MQRTSEYELRMRLGMDLFREGLRLCTEGRVEGPRTLDDGIRVFDVRDAGATRKVIMRMKSGGRESYDCDCGDGDCGHIAAAMISPYLPFEDPVEEDADDEEALSRILGMIETMDSVIECDNDFDHYAWTYEDDVWYRVKYGDESVEMNSQVQYDAAMDVYREIVTTLSSPDSVVYALNALRGFEGEYTGDGAEEVIREHMDEVRVYLSYASPEAVADCLEGSDGYGCWILDVSEHLGDGVLDRAVSLLRERGTLDGLDRRLRERLGMRD